MDNKLLSQILKDRGIKQTWVAERLRVSNGLVNGWVKGTKSISDKHKIELQSLLLN